MSTRKMRSDAEKPRYKPGDHAAAHRAMASDEGHAGALLCHFDAVFATRVGLDEVTPVEQVRTVVERTGKDTSEFRSGMPVERHPRASRTTDQEDPPAVSPRRLDRRHPATRSKPAAKSNAGPGDDRRQVRQASPGCRAWRRRGWRFQAGQRRPQCAGIHRLAFSLDQQRACDGLEGAQRPPAFGAELRMNRDHEARRHRQRATDVLCKYLGRGVGVDPHRSPKVSRTRARASLRRDFTVPSGNLSCSAIWAWV